MSTQPIWLTPAGSLGTVAEGTFYEVPLTVTDSVTINIIKIYIEISINMNANVIDNPKNYISQLM